MTTASDIVDDMVVGRTVKVGCGNSDRETSTFEERVTLWQARTFEEAIALADADANTCAADLDFRFLGLSQAYCPSDAPGHGAEVFSLLRDSELSADDYVSRFFDTGREYQGEI